MTSKLILRDPVDGENYREDGVLLEALDGGDTFYDSSGVKYLKCECPDVWRVTPDPEIPGRRTAEVNWGLVDQLWSQSPVVRILDGKMMLMADNTVVRRIVGGITNELLD